jgi:chromosome segregation ATPase
MNKSNPFGEPGMRIVQRPAEVPRADEIGPRVTLPPYIQPAARPAPSRPALTEINKAAPAAVQKAQKALRKAETALNQNADEIERLQGEIEDVTERRDAAKRAANNVAYKKLKATLADLESDLEIAQEQTEGLNQKVATARRSLYRAEKGPDAQAAYALRYTEHKKMLDREAAHRAEAAALAQFGTRHTNSLLMGAERVLTEILGQDEVLRIKREVDEELKAGE